MRNFTTDNSFKIVEYGPLATYLFEHIETYANGFRIRVQRKNENGLWGGRDDDDAFTFCGRTITPKRTVEYYLSLLEEERRKQEEQERDIFFQ